MSDSESTPPTHSTPTGPKTARGKQNSSRNARTHGFFSKDLILTKGDGREDPQEFAKICQDLREYWQPVGLQEDLLVEQIATWYWRMRRLVRYETGSSRQIADTAVHDEELRQIQFARDQFEKDPRTSAQKLRASSWGLDLLIRALEGYKLQLQAGERISEQEQLLLGMTLGGLFDPVAMQCVKLMALIDRLSQPDRGGPGAPVTAEECRKQVVELIAERIEALRTEQSTVRAGDDMHLESHLLTCSIPVAKYDTILKYHTTCERNVFRCMDQLERLQRIREGERVQPPVSVNVLAEILARRSGEDPVQVTDGETRVVERPATGSAVATELKTESERPNTG